MQRPERKLNRHRNFDYSLDGCYFVTTRVKNFVCPFGKIQNDQMTLNKFGKIVKQQLLWLPKQYPYIRINEWCVMPDHVHAIIIIDRHNMGMDCAVGAFREHVGTGLALSLRNFYLSQISLLFFQIICNIVL